MRSREASQLLRSFVAMGGNVNEIHSNSGWTLLRAACEHMNLDLIAELGSIGADPNLRSVDDGWTAMHHAVDVDIDSVWQATHAENLADKLTFDTVKSILAIGGAFDVPANDGRLPRDVAAGYGDDVASQFDITIRDRTSR